VVFRCAFDCSCFILTLFRSLDYLVVFPSFRWFLFSLAGSEVSFACLLVCLLACLLVCLFVYVLVPLFISELLLSLTALFALCLSAPAIGDPNIWIMKPVGLSRGRGISLVHDISQVSYSSDVVIQKYVHNPLLLDGYKFDLRLYILVTSFSPLEAFIYKVRSCTSCIECPQPPALVGECC
jgi:hypothetical protein